MGRGAHVLTFPVNHGKVLNVVAFCTNANPWTDYPQLTRPAKREHALADFQGFNSDVHAILKMIKSDIDCVRENVCPFQEGVLTSQYRSGPFLISAIIQSP